MQTNGSDVSSTTGYEAIKPQWVKRLPSSAPVHIGEPAGAATSNKPLLEHTRSSQHASGLLLQWASISKAAKGSTTMPSQSRPQSPAPKPQMTACVPASQDRDASTGTQSRVPVLSKSITNTAAKPVASSETSQSHPQHAPNVHVSNFFSELDTTVVDR